MLLAAEILAFQAMARLFKTGMLLNGMGGVDQNRASFSNGWAHQVLHDQVIRTMEYAGSKTKRTVTVLKRLLKEVEYMDKNDVILSVPAVDS